MNIVDLRGTYGRNYPKRTAAIDKFITHHTAGEHPANMIRAQQAVADVDSFVRRTHGWPGFPYHGAIWHDVFFWCADWDRLGWHSAGHDVSPKNGLGDNNDRGVAVALLGNFTREMPPPRTLDTLVSVWHLVETDVGRALPLLGHQDVWPTACPGEWWASERGALLTRDLEPQPAPWEPNYEPHELALINAVGYLSGDVVRIENMLDRVAEANRVRLQFDMEPLAVERT